MGDLLALVDEENEEFVTLQNPSKDTSPNDLLKAHLPLEISSEVRERALELLCRIDPTLAELVPGELPFPPEDDPFTKTHEEWEAVWYSMRESALRVYLNLRMEFRWQLALAVQGEANDLKPWTYWAFSGARPSEGEPVYGLTEERRSELGWSYPGPATDFCIYGETSEAGATGG